MTLPLHHQLSFTISIIVLTETEIVDFYVHLLFIRSIPKWKEFFIGCSFHIKDESFCEEWLFFYLQQIPILFLFFISLFSKN